MEVWLSYKAYNVKLTAGAKREFYEKTKKDLIGSIQELMLCFIEGGKGAFKSQIEARKVLSEVDAVYLLHSIIKASNPNIPIEEIEDAIARSPWRMVEGGSDKCQPWPVVIHQVGLDYDDMIGGVVPAKKLEANILDLLGQNQQG